MTHIVTTTVAAPVVPRVTTPLTPLGLHAVGIEDGYWAHRQRLNHDAILDHCYEWMGRSGWIGNLELAAAGDVVGKRRGREFSDSEIYKLIEATSWEAARSGDPDLEARVRELTAIVGAAQEPDGYLNTNFGRPGQEPRYSDLQWGHELYNFGHLLQAAVARGRTAGLDDEFVGIARRVADHVCREFGPDGRDGICGHPCIEVGLAEFGRLVGDDRYIEQSRLFVERRGHGSLGDIDLGREYFQDEVPVRDATVLRGHAVRALYLSAGAVDVAVERGDAELLAALERQWDATVARRTYLTGGTGSRHDGEAFGGDWELPADRAYCETCAGVASIMFSWRLLLATGHAKYADLIERVLYNVISTSPAADGRAFFYSNTLHRRVPGVPAEPGTIEPRAAAALRAAWFEVSCCPPNVSRTLASLGTYLATTGGGGVQLQQYATATVRATLDVGEVALRMTTSYPRDGVIEVEILEAPGAEWSLSLRVPSWATGATLDDGAESRSGLEPGYTAVTRRFAAGDILRLRLPVAPRFSFPDSRIDGIRGTVAVERGPEVYCMESVDVPGADIDAIRIDAATEPHDGEGVTVRVRYTADDPVDAAWPYAGTTAPPPARTDELSLIPYHDWANRGPSTMRVWMRR